MFVFKAAVVGAGALGAEIAQVIASAGIPVVLQDIDPARVQPEHELITGTTAYEGFGDVDFVIEAAPEQMAVKQAVFTELDAVTPGHAILASTTSTLSITELGEVTCRPEKVVGFHFPSAGRLVEVVEGEDTAPETAQAAMNFAQAIRRLPIRCGEAPGFVVNRIRTAAQEDPGEPSGLRALVESCLVLEEGVAAARDIDLGMRAAGGMTPPPLAGADQTGLDDLLSRLEHAAEEWGPDFAPPAILRRLVSQGRLGVAAGQGFFPYPRPDAGWEDAPAKLETRGEMAIAWLDRPPANSLSPEMVQALRRLWDEVAGSGRVRVLVIASANPMLFCAGADIKAFQTLDEESGRRFLDETHGLLSAMEASGVATIAAVNGAALGGGCELAMACDVRIAADSASFGQPEINLGILPGFGGTQRLPRLIGPAQALALTLTGESIGAAQAYEHGLATEVVADHELFDTALLWARKLAGQAPLAVAKIKQVAAGDDLDAGIAAEKAAFVSALTSADGREGVAAFLGKRRARWTGT
jgi:enoyl-CoA hydratase/carnithine racemase